MYTLKTPIGQVAGVGPTLQRLYLQSGIETVQDMLLQVPLRYEDRSNLVTIADLIPNQLITLQAIITQVHQFYKHKKKITTAVAQDETGSVKLMWFNNSFITKSLQKGQQYLISGTYSRYKTIVHPTLERVGGDSIHTNRIIPIYTTTLAAKQGTTRRILKHICDHLAPITTTIDDLGETPFPLRETMQQLHFPDAPELVKQARNRLALEELVSLILHSHTTKRHWQQEKNGLIGVVSPEACLPQDLPFLPTQAQLRCISEIVTDFKQPTPMNRLLLGDVGSGKTVVASASMKAMSTIGGHSFLVAPTQVLAHQHLQTLSTLFPQQKIQLVTSATTIDEKYLKTNTPTWFIGTHALLNLASSQLHLPIGLVVYDEQHRFGVRQRAHLSQVEVKGIHPHVLTMTATPIPRSLLLTIFSHIAVSIIDELPKNRLPTKCWVVTEKKRKDAYDWIASQIALGKKNQQLLQVILVCPFIDPSESENLSHIPSAHQRFDELTEYCAQHNIRIALLHGRQPAKEKQRLIDKMFQQKIDLLITTTIVEVGVDLPQASIMCIEASERYGLATLHQLRGRVGRAGQQGYCMLFTSTPPKEDTLKRLTMFTKTLSGVKLAEYDLQHRGAGDIFGTDQHGFDQLEFASWSDHILIGQAKRIVEHIEAHIHSPELLFHHTQTHTPTISAN